MYFLSITLDGPGAVRLFPEEFRIYAAKGTSTSFHCSASCNPECLYTWFRGPDVTKSDSSAGLELSHLRPSDAGFYTCEAKNVVGMNISLPIELVVRGMDNVVPVEYFYS